MTIKTNRLAEDDGRNMLVYPGCASRQKLQLDVQFLSWCTGTLALVLLLACRPSVKLYPKHIYIWCLHTLNKCLIT
jgi:hypothetical protein